MALIKCAECGKDISSSADICPHCGFRLVSDTGICKVNGKNYDLSDILELVKDNPMQTDEELDVFVSTINTLVSRTNMKEANGSFLLIQIKDCKKVPVKYSDTVYRHKEKPQPINIPKCPTCGSPNCRPISDGKRWLTIGLFGLASSNVGKSYECLNCKFKW